MKEDTGGQDMRDMRDSFFEQERQPTDLQGMIYDVACAEEALARQTEIVEPKIADLRSRVARYNKVIFSVEQRHKEQQSAVIWQQEDLYFAMFRDGADTSSLDPMLVHGLFINRGHVVKAQEWISCTVDTQERLAVPNTPYLIIERDRGDGRSLPVSLVLGRTNGQPTELDFTNRRAANLLIPSDTQVEITHSFGNFIYKFRDKEKRVKLPAEKLDELRGSKFLIGNDEITAKIDQLANLWGIAGREEVVNDVMFFLWKAATELGHEEVLPERLKYFIPKWKASYLAHVTDTLATLLSGVNPDKPVLDPNYLRDLGRSFSFSEDDVTKLIYRVAAQARNRGGDKVNEKEVETLPEVIELELGITAAPVEVQA